MIFWQLFLTFSKIGIVNFGGGYAMLSLIHNEVVEKHAWLTSSEFTDIVAISQSTPGPIGINCATYTGYTAVLHSGLPEWMAVLGAITTTISILWLPFILMLIISHVILKSISASSTQGARCSMSTIFSVVRPSVVGLIAAAAVLLMNSENFGSASDHPFQFICSICLFAFAFVGSMVFRIHPIWIVLLSGVAGLAIY